MRSRRRMIRRLRALALGLAAIAALAPAGALALPGQDVPISPSQAKIGDTPADFASAARVPERHHSSLEATAGDTPGDFPGASRAPEYQAPTTFEVVRPERTIVRDVDEELPIIIAGLALLIAVGGAGYALVRVRAVQRRLTH